MPGAVDGWTTLLGRYGKVPLTTVLAPAIRLAEQGFPISQRIGTEWVMSADLLAKDPDTSAIYLNHGKSWGWGDIFRNPDLGKALRLVAAGGRDAFYKGPIAQAIVAKSKATGGLFELSDFDRIHARWVDPISTTFNGYTVHEMPPSTQGFAVLEILNLVEQCPARLGLSSQAINPRWTRANSPWAAPPISPPPMPRAMSSRSSIRCTISSVRGSPCRAMALC